MKINKNIKLSNLKPIVNNMDIEECLNNLWMEIGDVRELQLVNPLLYSPWDDKDKMVENIVELSRNDDYLHFVTKYILNIDLLPIQCVMLKMLWHKPLPMLLASRGLGKSFILAVYIVLRMILHQGCRICVTGASLRQSMILYEYILQIWDKAPVLQDICGGKKSLPRRDQHMCYWNVGASRVVFLPMGDGQKIRGQRANIIIADEFSSISAEIFQTVVQGFASVKSDNLHYNVVQAYKESIIKEHGENIGLKFENLSMNISTALSSNQIIISGTPSYQFNHFYHYYKMYKSIITGEIFKDGENKFTLSSALNPADYAIIRIPYDLAPVGMMDLKIINQAKATMDPQIFMQEYGACFPADSEGFFLASWLHQATCPCNDILFGPKLVGIPEKSYVMAIDAASEEDNFAIAIIERNPEEKYRGLVYVWTTNRKDFESNKKLGLINPDIQDYNTFCIKHIRHLLRRFNIELILVDAGGGGVAVKEMMHDPDKKLSDDDYLVYDMDDEFAQGEIGRHILKLVQFSNSKWRSESHWGLQQDILSKKLLFPAYDLSVMELQSYFDDRVGKVMDTTEDCYMEIEQCKRETTLIKHTQTNSGQERWDIPKVMGLDPENSRKYMKKDRFTALLIANWGCRWLEGEGQFNNDGYSVFGMASDKQGGETGVMYTGRGAARLQNIKEYTVDSLDIRGQESPNGRKIYY